MDLSIDQLLSALQTTQQAKSTTRLSDRNVVELVNKLKQLGIIGDSLLHTLNGREYITTERLKTEVKRALQQVGEHTWSCLRWHLLPSFHAFLSLGQLVWGSRTRIMGRDVLINAIARHVCEALCSLAPMHGT